MVTEDISDLIKGGVAFGIPTTTVMGVPLQEWMFIVSICAALLLILERLPSAINSFKELKDRTYGRFKK